MVFISPTRLITTRRSAPARSVPLLNALRTTARNVNRNSATANDPTVSSKRIFLRNRLAKINRENFTPHPPPAPSAETAPLQPGRLSQDATSCVRETPPPDRV